MPDTESQDAQPDVHHEGRGRTPRWVVIAAGVALVLLVLFIVLHLSGSPVHH
jgi:type VI protein secretion system component VasF